MSTPLYNLTDIWNAGATVFAAIQMNVTDTSSDPASLLLDLQVASTSKFRVSKDGYIRSGGPSSATLVSPPVGNVFTSHTAIGGYADVNKSYSHPGDPVNSFQFASTNTLAVSDRVSGNLSGIRATAIAPSLGVKHTGGSNMTTAAGVEQFLTINSDSTGPVLLVYGGFFTVTNYGSGNISSMWGQYNQVQTYAGGGTITKLAGAIFDVFTASGYTNTVTDVYGAYSLVDMEQGTIGTANGFANIEGFFYNCTVGTYRGFYSKRPTISGVIPPTITNTYGLLIDNHASIGSALSYNIVSVGPGGNLFQGATVISNDTSATIDPDGLKINLQYDVADAGGTFGRRGRFGVSNNYTANWSGLTVRSIQIYDGFAHTGGTNANFTAIDFSPKVAAASTGPIDTFVGLDAEPYNKGSGHINTFTGVQCVANQFGSGTIGAMTGGSFIANASGSANGTTVYGGEFVVFNGGATYTTVAAGRFQVHGYGAFNVTDAFGIKIDPTTLGGGTGTNTYGLYVDDCHGIGGTRSENIRSVGALSLNVFEGAIYNGVYIEGTEVSAPAAPPANGYRIFAQDNGSGKTQLMVIFASGAAQQLAIQP